AEELPAGLLPLYFALVGCLTLPMNRGVAALVAPEVDDLELFTVFRPLMTPTGPKESVAGNAADAALQAQVRLLIGLRSKGLIAQYGIPGCYAMTFMPTTWASQQKSRVATIYVPPGNEKSLRRFEIALGL